MAKDKTARFQIRLTPTEKENLIKKASEAHMTVSHYIVSLSENKRIVLTDDIAKLTVEISRIGNNINQIAHIANSQKFVNQHLLNAAVESMRDVEQLMKKILAELYNDDEHTIISLEQKIDKLTERIDNNGSSQRN